MSRKPEVSPPRWLGAVILVQKCLELDNEHNNNERYYNNCWLETTNDRYDVFVFGKYIEFKYTSSLQNKRLFLSRNFFEFPLLDVGLLWWQQLVFGSDLSADWYWLLASKKNPGLNLDEICEKASSVSGDLPWLPVTLAEHTSHCIESQHICAEWQWYIIK